MTAGAITVAAGLLMSSVVAAVMPTASAWAGGRAPLVISAVANRYVPPEITISQGDDLWLVNPDVAPHDVTSDAVKPDGTPLFASSSAPIGGTAKVRGAEWLQPGVYTFFCTLHEAMRGRLLVEPHRDAAPDLLPSG